VLSLRECGIAMRTSSLPFEALREYLRSSLWLLPSVSVLTAFALGSRLSALTVLVAEQSPQSLTS
jgi:uncharacterized membrane protein